MFGADLIYKECRSLAVKVIVVDMDGTLVDVTKIQDFLRTPPRNWKAFFEAIPHCPPREQVLAFVRSMVNDCRIWVVGSARPYEHIDKTEANLRKFGLTGHYAPYRIYHRPEGDYRPDEIIKVEMYDKMVADNLE